MRTLTKVHDCGFDGLAEAGLGVQTPHLQADIEPFVPMTAAEERNFFWLPVLMFAVLDAFALLCWIAT